MAVGNMSAQWKIEGTRRKEYASSMFHGRGVRRARKELTRTVEKSNNDQYSS